ncbi:MAG: Riboflavin transporter PnuX [uncultured Nocardioidaceae bacterium]|uniref:Riboflavin transporter PnuX n=1 Tax=uncultured Nocardioidaceae bacterium TaxID=253824 RepID=A0A6J4N3G5_9ACTN|nr:MAG: Riboflavin transporter PnuX [uncultured Nocardioidaceae bacterium]
MSPLEWLFASELVIAGAPILVREIVGNAFGIASAIGGMRRRVWAWPVGIVGNVLLFTVFTGAVFDTPQDKQLWGQAGRQIFFVAVSLWGWWRWRQARAAAGSGNAAAVVPRWATTGERIQLVLLYAAGTAFFWWLFGILGSYGRLTEAWILTGSILATYGMARGWVEFWLIWLAVDAVGVPTLLNAGFYPSAVLYAVYGAFCVWGFLTWLRVRQRPPSLSDPAAETVGV